MVLTQNRNLIFIIKDLYCVVDGGGNGGKKGAREVPC